jgi:hypothetical protein
MWALRASVEPLDVGGIHEAVEELLGYSMSRSTVKNALPGRLGEAEGASCGYSGAATALLRCREET